MRAILFSLLVLVSLHASAVPGGEDVLVQLRVAPDLAGAEAIGDRAERVRFVYDRLREAAESQASLVEFLRKRGVNFRAFHVVNAVLVEAPGPELVRELRERPEVSEVRTNTIARLSLPANPPGSGPRALEGVEASLRSIGVPRVWAERGVRGEGIVIGGQDTGYAWDHPAIQRQYRGYSKSGVDHRYNWHDAIHRTGGGFCAPDSRVPCDDHGHGTHTMGTMVGDDGAGNQIGVAPAAQWIGCRNMYRGVGTLASYLECFEFFLAPYPQGGDPRRDGRPELAPHIVNNSWVCPPAEGCRGDELLGAVRALRAAGILVVAGAGNDGPGCGTIKSPPGSYTGEVLSVAAYAHGTGVIARFSSRGPSAWRAGVGPSLAAPGVSIRSSLAKGGYGFMSGTSMASPHVAGVAALLWSAEPALVGRIAETMARLTETAKPRTYGQDCGGFPGSQVPNTTFGHGTLDAAKALGLQKYK